MKKSDFFKNILLSLIAVAIFLLISEALVRIFSQKKELYGIGPVIFMESDNDILLYEMRPNASLLREGINITINSQGMRDFEYAPEKKDNVYRIAVLGDSVTANTDLSISDSYPKILEGKLNSNPQNKKFEVLNFGVNGYGTLQEIEVLKEKALRFNPDMIIIGYVLNDPLPVSEFHKNFFAMQKERKRNICKIYSANLRVPCALKNFIDSLSLPEFVYGRLLNIKYSLGGDFYTSLYKEQSKWESTLDSFKEANAIAEKNNIKLVLVIFPLLKDFKNYKWRHIHSRLANETSKYNFLVIDLLEEYVKYDEKEIKLVKNDILHPNKLGQEIAADAIYRKLAEENMLPDKMDKEKT